MAHILAGDARWAYRMMQSENLPDEENVNIIRPAIGKYKSH
jgi:hypothetical protein